MVTTMVIFNRSASAITEASTVPNGRSSYFATSSAIRSRSADNFARPKRFGNRSWLPGRTVSCARSHRTGAATMTTVRWSDIRDKHVKAIGREDVERGTSRLISRVRAHRLADMRSCTAQDNTLGAP